MIENKTLSFAIAAVLSMHATRAAHATNSAEIAQDPRSELQEVVVTATRRAQSLQDVPIAITALTSDVLQKLNVQTFNDFVRYLPNVTGANKGPGQGEVYMRGLSTTQSGSQTAGGSGPFPNVAIYLDDQSVQLPGRNLDIYAADMERIEVLEGPQGTLFGAGAQAGAVRYITNKPKINKDEGGVDASYAITAHGQPSTAVVGFINLPLIADKLAVRAVIYNDSRGGYIDNVPGTFARAPTDIGIVNYFGGAVPANSQTLSNTTLVKNDINPAVYKGVRASALYKVNDDWDALLQQSYQTLDADGVFAYDPKLGDLNVQQYNPSSSRDRFGDTAWSFNGRLGAVKAVYTGAYLNRHVNQVTDYTAYARGAYATYYQCNGPAFPRGTGTENICYSPSSTWEVRQQNINTSHEVRFSTPDDSRLRAVGGLFYQDFKIKNTANFNYGSADAGFFGQVPVPGSTIYDPSRRPAEDAFFSDITRGYRQKAIFGELAFDLLPKQLTLTVGTRFYNLSTYERGSVNPGYACRNQVECNPNPLAKNLDALGLHKTYVGHADKVNLTWKLNDQLMIYATYSEGFRPGGFNLGQGIISPSSPIYGKFTLPVSYGSDTLKNYEIGWKTQWLDRRLQINGAVYQEKWSKVQLTTFDPSTYGNIIFTANGPDYRVRGVEFDISARLTDRLSVNSSFAWNSSEQTAAPSVISNAGTTVPLFPTAGLGSPLAQSPPFAGNIRARYEWPVSVYNAFVQVGAQHTAHSYASVATHYAFEPPNYNQEAYTTVDASLGLSKGTWNLELFGQNLTDKRAELYINGFDFVRLTTPNRPRIIGVKLSYRFKDDTEK